MTKKVKMEHLGHFSSVFEADMLLFSCDLKSAYFALGVDDRTSRTMGFEWEGKYYRFTCCPFGWKMSSYSFVKTGRQVLRKWRQQGPGRSATTAGSSEGVYAEALLLHENNMQRLYPVDKQVRSQGLSLLPCRRPRRKRSPGHDK